MRVIMKTSLNLIKKVAVMVTVPVLFTLQILVPLMLACMTDSRFWITFLSLLLPFYLLIVRQFRYQRVNMIKKRYGFTDDPKSYKDMTPDEAQATLKNLAEWDCPFVFEFGWISEFFKVRSYCWAYCSFSLARVNRFWCVPLFWARLFGIL